MVALQFVAFACRVSKMSKKLGPKPEEKKEEPKEEDAKEEPEAIFALIPLTHGDPRVLLAKKESPFFSCEFLKKMIFIYFCC